MFFGAVWWRGNKISSKGIFVLYNHVKGISHVSEFTENFVTIDNQREQRGVKCGQDLVEYSNLVISVLEVHWRYSQPEVDSGVVTSGSYFDHTVG